MFRLYSKGCEYAIRALMQLAPEGGRQRFQAKAVCKKAGIPESFTRKVFQSLVQAGFLEAVRGPGGGYVLVEEPAHITLLSIIRAVDGADTFEGCIMGLEVCGSDKPCPLHYAWGSAMNEMLNQLESKSLADLCLTVQRQEVKAARAKESDGSDGEH